MSSKEQELATLRSTFAELLFGSLSNSPQTPRDPQISSQPSSSANELAAIDDDEDDGFYMECDEEAEPDPNDSYLTPIPVVETPRVPPSSPRANRLNLCPPTPIPTEEIYRLLLTTFEILEEETNPLMLKEQYHSQQPIVNFFYELVPAFMPKEDLSEAAQKRRGRFYRLHSELINEIINQAKPTFSQLR